MPPAAPRLLGIDFTSRPSQRKPITVAEGYLQAGQLQLHALHRLPDFASFEALLAQPGPWLAGCDFPFGLPRELVQTLAWPQQWPALMQQLQQHSRPQLVALFKQFCAARPAGQKFAHRAADQVAGSSSSMKWVNPPVAYMLLEGAPRLLAAGVHLPGLHAGDPQRIALEAYPGMLARQIAGSASYKSDNKSQQNAARRLQRERILQALQAGQHALQLPLQLADAAQATNLLEEGSADQLDAVLCLVEVAWASSQVNYGLPEQIDPLEGWIIAATQCGR